MQRIEDAKPRLPRRMQDLQHMRNTIICVRNSLQAIPYFASLGNEVVVRIDHQKCSDLVVTFDVPCLFLPCRHQIDSQFR